MLGGRDFSIYTAGWTGSEAMRVVSCSRKQQLQQLMELSIKPGTLHLPGQCLNHSVTLPFSSSQTMTKHKSTGGFIVMKKFPHLSFSGAISYNRRVTCLATTMIIPYSGLFSRGKNFANARCCVISRGKFSRMVNKELVYNHTSI